MKEFEKNPDQKYNRQGVWQKTRRQIEQYLKTGVGVKDQKVIVAEREKILKQRKKFEEPMFVWTKNMCHREGCFGFHIRSKSASNGLYGGVCKKLKIASEVLWFSSECEANARANANWNVARSKLMVVKMGGGGKGKNTTFNSS